MKKDPPNNGTGNGEGAEKPNIGAEVDVDGGIMVKTKTGHYRKILPDAIYVLKSEDHSTYIMLQSDKICVTGKMSDLLILFANPKVIKVHRRYAINIDKEFELRGNWVSIRGMEVPIGKTYMKEFKKHLKFIKPKKNKIKHSLLIK